MSTRDEMNANTHDRGRAAASRRTDEIRRRRTAQSHASRQKERRQRPSLLGGLTGRSASGRRASTAMGAPPVMARGFAAHAPSSAAKRGYKARRLYNVSLSAPGAEMRLPTLPRIGLGWRSASFLLLAFLLGILYYFWTAPDFQVNEAKVSGLQRITRADVNRALALQGQPVFTLDAGQIQNELLEAFPEFSQVAAQIELPNTLVITVTERVPVLIWRQDGASKLVDAQGMTFPARDEAALSAYPVIEAAGDPPPLPGATDAAAMRTDRPVDIEKVLADGLKLGLPLEGEATPFLAPETVAALLQIIDQAPNGAQIIYEPAHGFGWLDRRGWKVYFGHLSPGEPPQIEARLQVYRAILDQVKAAGAKPSVISVEYLHVPYYQLEPSE